MGKINREEGHKSMNDKYKEAIEKRQNKEKEAMLKNLRKTPIVQVSCNQSGISRATFYRWKKEDKKFRKEVDKAMRDGESLINDMSESQIVSLIKEKHWSAISFWLRHHHPKYANKIEVDAKINQLDEKLTPKQEAIVRRALAFISRSEENSSDKKHEKDSEENN